jgi:hypothetical protein
MYPKRTCPGFCYRRTVIKHLLHFITLLFNRSDYANVRIDDNGSPRFCPNGKINTRIAGIVKCRIIAAGQYSLQLARTL